ncbi:rhodanese-related sulfurtransferase [Hazenella sp. IB182357]|uniref:tRNA uridine(34) hydroxylase n=1 Tax=Polycladospora coralii TaxID=2771432 RepID=A0A926RTL5_9BACL|nr:rhodanese-related sulfurtransferase [Polycladospora coralii]MBS7528973.1 rhodanese-related sulfurtransferase [Polycladospora coralii]
MNTQDQPYQILLYYKYTPIEEPEQFADQHYDFCEELGLKGRVLISKEGINGTLSGPIAQTEKYMAFMQSHPLFHDMVFKIDPHDGHAFPKLKVRARDEIVTWRIDREANPYEKTGKHLSPKEFYEHLQREDVIVIDGRNDYEYDIGHFRGAIRPDVETTRDFPEWIRQNFGDQKDKKFITYCTGGIRCEKLTAFMIEEGFEDVAQLDGGIVSYGKDPEVRGKLFDGKCYVFDERISVPINQEEDKVVGKCHHCGKPEDRYINCAYCTCNHQHICCTECEEEHQSYCSPACKEKHVHQLTR